MGAGQWGVVARSQAPHPVVPRLRIRAVNALADAKLRPLEEQGGGEEKYDKWYDYEQNCHQPADAVG